MYTFMELKGQVGDHRLTVKNEFSQQTKKIAIFKRVFIIGGI